MIPKCWPPASSFSVMLQNPRIAFRVPELKACEFEKNDLGQPRPWAGNFATVYRAKHPCGKSIAVRIFSRGVPEQRERYEVVADYLSDHTPQSLVSFEYHEEGIRCAYDGKMYPMLTMEWVRGSTLFNWLDGKCKADDRSAIRPMPRKWVELIEDLSKYRIAHGDLQHGNVIVLGCGDLKLVDYDCMCVPDLLGQRNLEIGVKPYQHPERNGDTPLSMQIDNFSALFIFVALLALAVDPSLWTLYVVQASYDKLLFRHEDFADRGTSRLYSDLVRSSNRLVRRLTKALFDLHDAKFDDVPPLRDLLQAHRSLKLHRVTPSPVNQLLEESPPEPSGATESCQHAERDIVSDVEQLDVAISDGVMTLRWKWPPNIDACCVAMRSDCFPSGPTDARANVQLLGRFQYDHQGGFRFRVAAHGGLYVTVYSAARAEDAWQYSAGNSPDCRKVVRLHAYRRIAYRVLPRSPLALLRRDADYKLVITPDAPTQLPELLLVVKENGLPLHPGNGTLVARIQPGYPCSPDQPLVVPFRLADPPRHWQARLFAADESESQWTELVREQ